MSEYWWDRSGRDPDLERIEALLCSFAFRTRSRAEPTPSPAGRKRLAAALVAASAFALLLLLWAVGRRPAWDVYTLAGKPTIEGTTFSGLGRWSPGQALETGPDARAKVLVGRIGEIDLEPDSRLRLVHTDRKQHRLALDRGSLRAFIWAPPRRFLIETREALAVDLGCAYSLRVEPSGEGWLRVAFGWVSFETDDREVYVPAGAACLLHRGRGPGTPHFEDASERFRAALASLDEGGADGATLEALLAEARKRDALTLLQLLPRLDPAGRARLYEHLRALVPPPPGVDREAILRADTQALGRYWDALGLGELKWWRLGRDLTSPPNRP